MKSNTRQLIQGTTLAIVLLIGLVIALMPEPPARVLTSNYGWEVRGAAGVLRLSEFPDQYRHVRRSVVETPVSVFFRSWTPAAGVQQIEVVSPPFEAPQHLGVAVTGDTRPASGKNAAFLSCSDHAQLRPIFLGSSNVAATESLMELPANWCAGETRLHLIAGDRDTNVGLGTAFAVSALSTWKASFVGLLPYLMISLAIPILIGVVVAGMARRLFPAVPILPTAMAGFGLAALLLFYAYPFLGSRRIWLVLLPGLLILWAIYSRLGLKLLRDVYTEVRPFAVAWIIGAVTYFALLSSAHNGVGHWDPNYRFWPATWSSDNELPWMFAEAIRHGQNVSDLYGGQWKPTDRPPLMAGAYLLVADTFGALQSHNDGDHLKGICFNVAATAFSTAWIPAILYVLTAGLGLQRRAAIRIVILIGLLPFSIFNSIYGWPKALGAAFGLCAVGVALAVVRNESSSQLYYDTILFGILSALSLLSHSSNAVFLIPLGIWLFVRRLPHLRSLALGAFFGLTLLAIWNLYQHLVLPSSDPLTKYALVGDFGFGSPGKSMLTMLSERYGGMTFTQWLNIKVRMLAQPLWPLSTSVASLSVDHDFISGTFRTWDTLFLSIGNVPILIGTFYVVIRRFRKSGQSLRSSREPLPPGAASLVMLGLTTWALLAFLFMAPLILPVWPFTAVFALAAAGIASLHHEMPGVFRIVTLTTVLYVALSWFVLPLRLAQEIEILPLMLSSVLLTGLIIQLLSPEAANRTMIIQHSIPLDKAKGQIQTHRAPD